MNSVDPQAPRIQALVRRREELMAERSKLVTRKGRPALGRDEDFNFPTKFARSKRRCKRSTGGPMGNDKKHEYADELLEPGWINRQCVRIERDVQAWPAWMRQAAERRANDEQRDG